MQMAAEVYLINMHILKLRTNSNCFYHSAAPDRIVLE